MSDRRRHRGPHPEDVHLFQGAQTLARMRTACAHLSWLLEHGYATPSALKLVGDRFALRKRQRIAVLRAACGSTAARRRILRRVEPATLENEVVLIDGHNVLTTIEAALAGGVLLVGCDGAVRDMASVHGTWRQVEETEPALECLATALCKLKPRSCRFYLDAPVSNSGRLATLVRNVLARHTLPGTVHLVPSADPELIERDEVVASADSAVLDRAKRWFDLPAYVVQTRVPTPWIVDLRSPQPAPHPFSGGNATQNQTPTH